MLAIPEFAICGVVVWVSALKWVNVYALTQTEWTRITGVQVISKGEEAFFSQLF